MVDRESRDKLALLLQSHLNGEISMPDVIKEVSKQSQDPAIEDMLTRFETLPIGLTQLPGCDEWAGCSDNCNRCKRIKSRDQRRKGALYKRTLSRVIMFLCTDREYRWYKEYNEPPFWKSVLIALVIVIGIAVAFTLSCYFAVVAQALLQRLGIHIDSTSSWFLLIIAIGAVISLINKIRSKRNGPDDSYWPFYSRQDYESYIR